MRALLTAVLFAAGLLFPVFAQKPEMTYEQYLTELNTVIQRENAAREAITVEQARIDSLNQQISQLSLRIAGVIQEQYTILGITEQDVTNAEIELTGIASALRDYVNASNETLTAHRQEIEQLDTRFGALKDKRICLLFRIAEKARDVDAILAQVLQQLKQASAVQQKPVAEPPAAPTTYIVGRSGTALNLSQIARDVYGDQYQWPRIYRANKALVDKWYARYKNSVDSLGIGRPQDFVLPGWTLEIPR